MIENLSRDPILSTHIKLLRIKQREMPDGIAIVGEAQLEEHHAILQTYNPDCMLLYMGLVHLQYQGELCEQTHGASRGDLTSTIFI